MEADQQKSPEEVPEVSEPTAREMAAAEEVNAARRIALAKNEEKAAEALPETSTLSVAAQGREALRQAFEAQKERAVKAPYVPPPRTERQMSALQEELEAGRRTQARAQEQHDNKPQPKPDPNEGFTTPVHRPGNVVPDPTIPAKGGSVAGNREYGADAP